ncbi:MAG: dimethylsulfoniopropionate demethylase [Rhodobacteraceae bacterium]|nr:MAG: dimethylsulfoniopropionate demethylase [Paracoccaceae bacterium]
MSSHFLSLSHRTRKTHFTKKVIAAGVKAFTVYNHMLLPTVFKSVEEDYHHLKKEVQIWDVSCERQVEISGPDAKKLIQKITPRDLAPLTKTKCFYAPLVNSNGGMINDPIIIMLAEDRYWISISDSDALLWIMGISTGLQLNVSLFEPDVSPLAIQGPKSRTLMKRLFGSKIEKLKFFGVAEFQFLGSNLIISRSGWSKQGGYEIYVNGPKLAETLWDKLFETGYDLNVRAGCPNLIERIEGGLLSYGNDMTLANTPFECGFGKFMPKVVANHCIGAQTLNSNKVRSPSKIIKSLSIDHKERIYCEEPWEIYNIKNEKIGQITSAAYSPDFQKVVALGMINTRSIESEQTMYTSINNKKYTIQIEEKPFI